MNAYRRPLSVELLESRTLLAGDPFGLLADFELTKIALSGTGEFDASFSVNFGNKQLVLTGTANGNLTIDLDRLPAFITNLKISSFAEVKMVGVDKVETIVFNHVGSVVAPDLSVTTSLHLNDVGSVDLAAAGAIAVLKGSNTELKVRSLDDTMIISDLQSLTLESESRALLVVVLNSEQKLRLNYSPTSIAFPGLVPNSVNIGNDPIMPGPGPDMGPANGTGTGLPGEPAADPVTIITLPLDERTRAFIAELREMLRSSARDPQQFVFDFVAHGNTTAATSARGLAARQIAALLESVPPDLNLSLRAADGLGSLDGAPDEAAKPWVSNLGAPESASLVNWQVQRQLERADSKLPAENLSGSVVELDATWPVAMTPTKPDDAPHLARARPVTEHVPESVKLEDSVRALGHYLVERVSAEFSPGQQSLILLVDPRPSRSAVTGSTTALDLFARSNRTSLSSLQQAVA